MKRERWDSNADPPHLGVRPRSGTRAIASGHRRAPPKMGGTAPCPDPTVRPVLGKVGKKCNLLTFSRLSRFWGSGLEKIDFFKIRRNRWGIKGNVPGPHLSYSGPSIRRYSTRHPDAYPARAMADFHGLASSSPLGLQRTCLFGVEKIDFPKISRNRWGIEGNVRGPHLSDSEPSIRRYSTRGPPAHPARAMADFMFWPH